MDEEQTDGFREPCGQCSAVEWAVSDEGRFYCRSCHNVIERTREVVDTSFLIGSSRISSIAKGTKHKRPGRGRQWMVCEGFQFILRNQSDALLVLGVRPHVKDTVCQLWRRYLQTTRQAYTHRPLGTVTFNMRDSESDSAAETSVASASETDGEADPLSTAGSGSDLILQDSQEKGDSGGGGSVRSGSVDAVNYLTPQRNRSGVLMNMEKTLAFLHLALVWTRETLTLADLLRLVNEAHVPYVNAYQSFPEEMQLHGKDSIIFRVQSVPSHAELQKVSEVLAEDLQLPRFPPISHQCLLHPTLLSLRYLTEINLPEELHVWVCRVMTAAGMAAEGLNTFDPLSRSGLPLYDVQAAALIIITMKFIFGMDDHTEWDLSNAAADRDDEEDSENVFNMRRWFRLLQTVLSRTKQRNQEEIGRKQWKCPKVVTASEKNKSVYVKRRRVSEQIQMCFEKLSGSSAGPERSSPSSFRFCWGDGEESDGPSLHHKTLDGVVLQKNNVLIPSNQQYWHCALKVCSSCSSHYEEVEPTLPRVFVWLLELFSFLLEVKPGRLLEEVQRVEQRLLSGRPSGGRH